MPDSTIKVGIYVPWFLTHLWKIYAASSDATYVKLFEWEYWETWKNMKNKVLPKCRDATSKGLTKVIWNAALDH